MDYLFATTAATVLVIVQGASVDTRAAGLIHDIYMWYEHYFRDLTVLLGAFLTYVLVFGGTYVLDGRWQCSRLCFMNDVHAETLGEAAYNSF